MTEFYRYLERNVLTQRISLEPDSCWRVWTWSISWLYDLQIVRHRENAGNTTSAKRDQVLVGFGVNHAFQSDASILHDDTDGLLHAQGVFFQRWVSIDGTVQLQTESSSMGGGQGLRLGSPLFRRLQCA
jgi:hypothetical protein